MTTAVQPKLLREILSSNLLHRRKELGMTQAEVAEKAGVTAAFVTQLERGARVPHLDHLAVIAEALNTTPSALLSPEIFSGTAVDRA